MDNNRVFGWDDEIEKEDEFILIDEGEYDFKVAKFERGRYDGGEKLPACNKAILTLEVETPKGKVNILHNLFLHSKCEWQLSQFFIAIGHKKHGEKLRMNWNIVVGAKGRAKIGIRTWKDKNGNERKSNEVKSFLDPAAPAQNAVPTVQYTAGEF